MLSEIENRARGVAENLAHADFASEAGRLEAIKNQGVVLGLRLAIEMIIEPTKELEHAE